MNTFGSILFGSAFALGIAAGAATAIAEPVKIEKIDVTATYASVENGTAAVVWPDLAADIQGRLAQALLPLAVEEGTDGAMKVDVTVEEVSLDGTPILGGAGEFNRLLANVKVTHEEGTNNQVFTLDVNTRTTFPEGIPEGWTVIAPTPDTSYDTMVNAFVNATAQRILEIDA